MIRRIDQFLSLSVLNALRPRQNGCCVCSTGTPAIFITMLLYVKKYYQTKNATWIVRRLKPPTYRASVHQLAQAKAPNYWPFLNKFQTAAQSDGPAVKTHQPSAHDMLVELWIWWHMNTLRNICFGLPSFTVIEGLVIATAHLLLSYRI